jgi:hypothetical protein
MEYFTIITMHAGTKSATYTMTVTAPPGATRQALYEHVRTEAISRSGPDFATAAVSFFSAEPNTLAHASR